MHLTSALLFFLQTKIDQMTTDQVRECLKKAAAYQPGMLLDIVQFVAGQQAEPNPAPEPGSSGEPQWCSCHNCREMPTEEEKVCCGHTPELCVSRTPASKTFLRPIKKLTYFLYYDY